MDVQLALLLALLVFVVVGGAAGMWTQRRYEIRQWNGGRHTCGQPWQHFGNDSQGGRGYVCRSCDACTWISYSVDRAPSP